MAAHASGPIVIRRRLGAELRRIREEANVRLEAAARDLEISPAKLSRLEHGQAVPKIWDVRNLLTLYGVRDDKLRDRLLRWANEGKAQGWWQPYSDVLLPDTGYWFSLEAEAESISIYSTPTIHALVQTQAYARVWLTMRQPTMAKQSIEQLVEARVRRQDMTWRSANVRLRIALDEAALTRTVGSAELMRDQLNFLLELPETVDLRIYRLAAGPHPLIGPLTIFIPRAKDFDPVVANVEASGYEAFFEDPENVNSFQEMFEDLWSRSASRVDSRTIMESQLEYLV